jgi:uncharacterized protein (DUF697 family)
MSYTTLLERPHLGDHVLIHGFASLAAAVGAGLAQLPTADAAMLASIQATMVMALSERYQVALHRTAAAELVLTLGATIVGKQASRRAGRRVPGWSNAVNAATAFALTEAVGWAAVAWFRRERPEEG